MSKKRSVFVGAALCAALSGSLAQAQDCNDLFNPDQVLTFNITMDPADWETLRLSCPGGTCDPPPHSYFQAILQCGSGEQVFVGIRRKSDLGEPIDADPQKVSLKLDINEFAPGQLFYGKAKLSLECGSGGATISEGLAYNIYQATDIITGRASWVNVYVNGEYKGLYNNVEQVDKVFLTNHGLDNGGWLFKEEDQRTRENPLELNAFAFNWYPFDHPKGTENPEVPAPADWLDQALWRINMPHLLTLGAAENLIASSDSVVFKMTNYFYYDWSILPGDDPAGQQPRLYFPWDQDTVAKSQEVDADILSPGWGGKAGHLAQGLVEDLDESRAPFGYPAFQDDYLATYKNLLNGPLALSEMLNLLNTLEPIVGPHLDTDPHQQTGLAADEFQRLRDFMQARTNSVVAQLAALGAGYPLQTSMVGSGSVIRNPDKPTVYDADEVVELTAVADPGWNFVTWVDGVRSSDNPLLVTMDAAKSVTAFFAQLGETVAIYDFNTNGGVDRFAYGTYTDDWPKDLEGRRQKCPEVCTEVTTIAADAYSRLALSDALGGDTDSNRYINPDEASGDESTLIAEFNIAEDPAEVLQLDVLWEGYGGGTHHLELYIWNYVQLNWGNGAGLFGDNNFMDDGSGDSDFILSGSVSSNFGEYISPTGQITLLVYDDDASEATFHDYMRLVVTVPFGECQVDGDCYDGVGCTDDTCVSGVCVFTPNDANCPDDGLFCTGTEFCDAAAGCLATGNPCLPGEICNELTDTCDPCQLDEDCDDGVACTDDTCVAGSCTFTPNDGNCDDGQYCNGAESCDALLDCQAGTPPDCDDGVSCTIDWCDELNDTCMTSPDDGRCDDGLWCNGAETCDALADCQAGIDPCPGQGCDEVGQVCFPIVCDDDGVCEAGEDCYTCPGDCFMGSGALCGNGVCEAADGEDCVSCPDDCNGYVEGKPSGRYCCGDGTAKYGVTCGDSRCTDGGNTCTTDPAAPSCCGDGLCEGDEDAVNCVVDCGCTDPAECDDANECTVDDCVDGICENLPVADGTICGGGICCTGVCVSPVCSDDPECEDQEACTVDTCADAGTCSASCDNTWPSCGLSDGCCGPDCTSADDPDCEVCLVKGEPCTLDSECCSNWCHRGACK